MKLPASTLLGSIHNTKRINSSVRGFSPDGSRTPIVLLDFIGCKDCFITSFGAIFYRRRLYTNRKGIITKGYLPLVTIDPYLPYKWSLIPTANGKIWFPLNQVLGWAFVPQEDQSQKYFINAHPNIYPQSVDSFEWRKDPPALPKNSKYLEFMQTLYQV